MPITTLSLSYDATLLLSGSQDETVKVWDIASRQMIKNFTHLKGPIVNIQTFIKPPDLFNLGLSPAKIMEQPIQQFKRTQGISIKEDSEIEESVIMVLGDNTKNGDATTMLQTQISELQSELIRIHGHYQHVKGLHDEMYQELVTDFISKRRAEGN
ncbi:5505_t:CDS:2 [Gigaspora margarita]|uniref:5505_t:CDS:1 n=1 Tax=Gigaspora margarita TaxID=4874 RepID=A0ABN7VLN0_GIGMA|nr:5505_t:CDS:2 [Gigaspora margarita]